MLTGVHFLSAALISPLFAQRELSSSSRASSTRYRYTSENGVFVCRRVPRSEYHWAPESAYEAFRDMKYGIRIHWGIYSVADFLTRVLAFSRPQL